MKYIDLFRGGAHQTPDAPAVSCGSRTLSFRDSHDRAAKLAGSLLALGLEAGDRICVLAWNELELIEIQVACMRTGIALVPINARLPVPEVAFILADIQPGLLIVADDLRDLARDAVKESATTPKIVELPTGEKQELGSQAEAAPSKGTLGNENATTGVFETYSSLLDGDPLQADVAPNSGDLPSLILYTSGTTGRPKGAIISRAALTARMMATALEMGFTPEDVWLQAQPMFHIGSIFPYTTIARGGHAVMQRRFDPKEYVELVQKHSCTASSMVPTMISMVLDEPTIANMKSSTMRIMCYGGAPIVPDVLRRALDVFGCEFEQWYGQTELSGATVLRPSDHDPNQPEKLNSLGVPFFGYETVIIGDDGNALPRNQVGEIASRGPAAFSGYWNRPDATASTIVGDWVLTGDIGYQDDQGYFHIVDRRNDMVISGGENVYPLEIERVLYEHPAIVECAVFGIPHEKWGEQVAAVFIGDVSEAELTAWARERLAGYKVPRVWLETSTPLPRNAVGKIQKHVIKAEALERLG
ncbi:MAG: AMP-binding protein [Armatimonadetes bacterium]|nr:AMP-binding protein [Armatimonadota bacterium]